MFQKFKLKKMQRTEKNQGTILNRNYLYISIFSRRIIVVSFQFNTSSPLIWNKKITVLTCSNSKQDNEQVPPKLLSFIKHHYGLSLDIKSVTIIRIGTLYGIDITRVTMFNKDRKHKNLKVIRKLLN